VRLAQFIIPPLTTIRMSQTDLARLAFKALLTEVEREKPVTDGTEYVLETDLVLRKSTALAPPTSN
jgi:DNA-binding LacI/PurR family transcriptional regulator